MGLLFEVLSFSMTFFWAYFVCITKPPLGIYIYMWALTLFISNFNLTLKWFSLSCGFSRFPLFIIFFPFSMHLNWNPFFLYWLSQKNWFGFLKKGAILLFGHRQRHLPRGPRPSPRTSRKSRRWRKAPRSRGQHSDCIDGSHQEKRTSVNVQIYVETASIFVDILTDFNRFWYILTLDQHLY